MITVTGLPGPDFADRTTLMARSSLPSIGPILPSHGHDRPAAHRAEEPVSHPQGTSDLIDVLRSPSQHRDAVRGRHTGGGPLAQLARSQP